LSIHILLALPWLSSTSLGGEVAYRFKATSASGQIATGRIVFDPKDQFVNPQPFTEREEFFSFEDQAILSIWPYQRSRLELLSPLDGQIVVQQGLNKTLRLDYGHIDATKPPLIIKTNDKYVRGGFAGTEGGQRQVCHDLFLAGGQNSEFVASERTTSGVNSQSGYSLELRISDYGLRCSDVDDPQLNVPVEGLVATVGEPISLVANGFTSHQAWNDTPDLRRFGTSSLRITDSTGSNSTYTITDLAPAHTFYLETTTSATLYKYDFTLPGGPPIQLLFPEQYHSQLTAFGMEGKPVPFGPARVEAAALAKRAQSIFDESGVSGVYFTTNKPDADDPGYVETITVQTARDSQFDVTSAHFYRQNYLGGDLGSHRIQVNMGYGFDLDAYARVIAHEVGHHFGLEHSNAPGVSIMDYDWGPGYSQPGEISFYDQPAPVVEPIKGSLHDCTLTMCSYSYTSPKGTQNPLWQLLSEVDGWTDAELFDSGLRPGTRQFHFGFGERAKQFEVAFDLSTLTPELQAIIAVGAPVFGHAFGDLSHGELFESASSDNGTALYLVPDATIDWFVAPGHDGVLDTRISTSAIDPFSNTMLDMLGSSTAYFHRWNGTSWSIVAETAVRVSIVPEPTSLTVCLVVFGAMMFRARQREISHLAT
jgi:hypothetical protein